MYKNHKKLILQQILERRNKSLILSIIICSLVINFLTIAIAFYSMQVFDKVLNSSSVETLIYITLFTVILIYFLHYFYNLRHHLNQKIANNIDRIIIDKTRYINELSVKIKAIENLQKIKSYFNAPISLIIYDIGVSGLYLLAIFLIHPLIALYGLLTLLALIFLENTYGNKVNFSKQEFQKNYDDNAKILQQITDKKTILNKRSLANNLLKKWSLSYKNLKNYEEKYFFIANNANYLNKNLRLLVQVFSTMICSYLVIKNHISIGSIIAVSILLSRMLEPFYGFVNNIKIFKDFIINYREVMAKIDDNPLMIDDVQELMLDSCLEISFNKVFYRDLQDKNIIVQIDKLTITHGKIIAIIANSKFEEYCLFNLLIKNYQPLFGNIAIDGYDIQKIAVDKLSDLVAIIEENPQLATGNVIENIAKMANFYNPKDIAKFINDIGCKDDIEVIKNDYLSDIAILNSYQKYLIGFISALYGGAKLLFIEKIVNNKIASNFSNKFLPILNNYKNLKSAIIFINNPAISIVKQCDGVIIFKEGRLNFFNTTEFFTLHEKTHKLIS